MEKIKEALAKVKRQKKPSKKAAGSNRNATRKKQPANIDGDIGNITYKTSAVVKLDAAHLEENRIVSHLSNDANTSVFDSLRTQVLQTMEENDWQTIAIVSPTPESGKTVVSTNLAISIAHQPQKTAVLVDFDLRRPKVARYLGIHTEKSINEYLEDKAKIEDVMVNPSIPRLIVMPTMRPVSRPAEALASGRVKGLIQELKDRYASRIIVFDLPPILGSDDAMVLLPHVDCILMVIANGVSTAPEIAEAMRYLPKENLIGVVYNKAENESKPYYY